MKHWIVIGIMILVVLIVAPTVGRGQESQESNNTVNIEQELPEDELSAGETTETDEHETTIYDVYTTNEVNALFGVVESETRGCPFEAKCNVVSVIFNRVDSPRFKQNTLMDVLMAPNQFSVVTSGAYKTVPVTQETINACVYVFENGDTANGALFFEGMKSNIHGSYATYIFNDGKHKFYY